jgi:2-polyprenyl-3-methyl-5-hydroxy-6-metoxy-1,4-benzoquinol methylase
MIERLTKCPLCKSGLFLNSEEVIDHAVSKESFIICKCTSCQILFTNPRPTYDHIARYYDFPEYYSHDDSAKGLTQLIYQQVKKIAINQKIKLLSDLKPKKGKLLDFGCGTGEFIFQARKKDWKIAGVEPNQKARKQAMAKSEHGIYKDLEALDKNERFDVITLFHVLEHVHDIRKVVKRLLKHLKSNGYLIIAVPNPDSYDAKFYQKDWAGWDVPRHLYHFTYESMKSFQNNFDLEIVDQKKMPFDSYYVSLLSERYQNPARSILINYLNAVKNGYKSNKFGNTKAGNYSSNIFIFKKK